MDCPLKVIARPAEDLLSGSNWRKKREASFFLSSDLIFSLSLTLSLSPRDMRSENLVQRAQS